jgi:hypothetical protein
MRIRPNWFEDLEASSSILSGILEGEVHIFVEVGELIGEGQEGVQLFL